MPEKEVRMNRHRAALLVLAAILLLGATSTASAKGGGLTLAKVQGHGWDCVPSEIMIHCVHPNYDVDAFLAGQLASLPSLNFSSDGTFLGTEILIRADLGDESRPCRQGTEPDGTYEAPLSLDFNGDGKADYYSCHHNNDV
jgi:hypothetical protein